MKDQQSTHERLSSTLTIIKDGATVLIQQEEDFVNMIFIVGEDFLEPLPFIFSNSLEKQFLVSMIQKLVKKTNAIGIIMVSDAWTTTHKPDGKAIDISKILAPSQSPDRKETLIITAIGLDFKKGFHIPYHRVNNKVILEKEQPFNHFEDLNFSSLFQKKFDA